MDGELLQRFWAGHEEERLGAANIADRILVFHRGISTVRASVAVAEAVSCACLLAALLCSALAALLVVL